jgi:nicotinamidase-related amidase
LGLREGWGQGHLLSYARALRASGKYDLTIWPYHAMLGGIGHALVSSFEEAIFFHSLARLTRPDFQIKGDNPLTENYSVLGPEVLTGPGGEAIAQKNSALIETLLTFDAVIIAGQAKSHCVAWTIQDLLDAITQRDPVLARKVYLLEDCTSPVCVPGIVDYTDAADAAFQKFAAAGMHLVRSTDPLANWPGISL